MWRKLPVVSVKVERLFADVAAEYDTVLPFFSALATSVVGELDLRPGMRVLDLGCGTGAVTAEALGRGCRVTAVDAVPEMIDRLRARRLKADAHVMDAHRLNFGDAAFDAVIAAFVMHLLDSPIDVAHEVHRTLTPGGWFALVLPAASNELGAGPDLTVRLFAEYAQYLPAGGSVGKPLDGVGLLTVAGFADITTTQVELLLNVPDVQTLWRWLHTHGTKAFLDDLPRARRSEFYEQLVNAVGPDGTILRRAADVHVGQRR